MSIALRTEADCLDLSQHIRDITEEEVTAFWRDGSHCNFIEFIPGRCLRRVHPRSQRVYHQPVNY
jgi:hypothetical protein